MTDAYNQQDLAAKAKKQMDLFQKAQEYAKEAGIQEMKAKQFANLLNESTRKAQYSRAMMFQAASQIRILTDHTLRAIQPMKCMGTNCFSPSSLNAPILTLPTTEITPIITNINSELVQMGAGGGTPQGTAVNTLRFKQKNLRN